MTQSKPGKGRPQGPPGQVDKGQTPAKPVSSGVIATFPGDAGYLQPLPVATPVVTAAPISTACPSVKSLRDTLERYILDLFEVDGSTLKTYTAWPGYYTLPDGLHIPAVYVVGAAMVPSNWAITGIELTIEDVPEISSPGSVGGVLSFENWNVRFTNYGTREGTRMPVSMLDISRRMARAFPRDPVTYMARTEVTYEALTARIRGAVLNPPIP